MRDSVRILRVEDCGDVEECFRTCFEDKLVEASPEELLKAGWLPRDCVVLVRVEREGGGR